MTTIYDRNGKELNIGDTIKVQHCIGRYGQTSIVSGELVAVDQWHGLTIKISHPYVDDRGRFGVFHLKIGESVYVASVFKYQDGKWLGYENFVDFEHGHESWVEKLETR